MINRAKFGEVDGQLRVLNNAAVKLIPLHLTYWLSIFMSCEFHSQNTQKVSIQYICRLVCATISTV